MVAADKSNVPSMDRKNAKGILEIAQVLDHAENGGVCFWNTY